MFDLKPKCIVMMLQNLPIIFNLQILKRDNDRHCRLLKVREFEPLS